MSSQPQSHEDLVEKLFDDRLSGDELHQLNDVLRHSPEAREHYWHLVMLEGYLADLPGWIAGQQYATKLAFSETLEAFIEMESNAEAQLQSYPAVADPVAERTPITWRDVRMVGAFCIQSLARQRATWAIAAAAAMICIVALVYATWFGGDASQPTSKTIADLNQDRPQLAPLPVEPVFVAVVRNQSLSGENATASTMIPGTKLFQGQVIDLQAGNAMQLEYKTGVRVILQGPGAFELLNPQRVAMQHGRITAVVPPQGKGFTVSTAQADFIDHGTEFAVALDETGHGEVIVLEGLIEARQANTDAQQSLGSTEGMMLREGVGGRLVPDAALPKSVESLDQFDVDRYARKWDDVIYRPVVSGQIHYVTEPPASLDTGQATSENPLLIPEQRSVILSEALHLNSNKANQVVINKRGIDVDPLADYVIPVGAEVDSFLIHFDISEDGIPGVTEREFKIRFKGRIIGIVEKHDYQIQTDGLFGLSTVKYPTVGAMRGASDPPGHPNYDVIWVSDDLQTMTVKMRLSGMDQIRVLVESTDP